MTTTRTDRLLLLNAMLGNFLAGFSARIFMISLPTIANGLDTDILGISWALISFDLASISLAAVFGRLADVYDRRAIYSIGLIILTASSFLCGISQNVLQLITFRFLQGAGGALTQSIGRVLAVEAVSEGSEGKALGLMTTAFHSGVLVGPPLGGFIIEYINWRGIFFLVVLIGLTGIALSYTKSKDSLELIDQRRRYKIDYAGAALLIILTTLLMLIFDRKASEMVGVGHQGLLTLALGAAFWGFLAHEYKVPGPILNPSLFKIRMFTCSVIALLSISITISLVSFLMPFYLQEILQISPSFMGLMFLAPPIFTITLATLSGHITDKVGPRVPAIIGVVAVIAALCIGSALRTDSDWIVPVVMLGLTGIGIAFFNTANLASIMGSVPKESQGFATGMVHMTFGLGHMLGVSLGGFLSTLAFQYYSGIAEATPDPENPFAFVFSINASCAATIGVSLVALFTSGIRGGGRIRAAADMAPG